MNFAVSEAITIDLSKGFKLDFYAQSIIIGSNTIFLSKKEFGLLSYMAPNDNRVVGVDMLFQFIWGDGEFGGYENGYWYDAARANIA